MIIVKVQGPHCGDPAEISAIVRDLPTNLPAQNPTAEADLQRFSLTLEDISSKLLSGLIPDLESMDKVADQVAASATTEATPEYSQDTIRLLWSQTDKDGPGALDRAEVAHFIERLGFDLSSQPDGGVSVLSAAMGAIDGDRDGTRLCAHLKCR